MKTFYLGTHRPGWLRHTNVPLFLSLSVLRGRRYSGPAVCRWALDSGGYSHLRLNGKWTFSPAEYAGEVRRLAGVLGRPDFAASMDWMCEADCLRATGKTVRQHQLLTTGNYLDLMSCDPSIPWCPVLQGYSSADYFRHADDYARRGVDLDRLPVVGVGSICRRQATSQVELLLEALSGMGIAIHAFGLKIGGLKRCSEFIRSADSMAWSAGARFGKIKHPECERLRRPHRNCANCITYAISWRDRIIAEAPDF